MIARVAVFAVAGTLAVGLATFGTESWSHSAWSLVFVVVAISVAPGVPGVPGGLFYWSRR